MGESEGYSHGESCPPDSRLVVRLGGRCYEASEEAHPGFQQRLEGSMLSLMSSGPCRVMSKVTSDGTLILQEEHLPEEVRRLFPELWSYLQTGTWSSKSGLSQLCPLRKALSFLQIKAELVNSEWIFLHKHVLSIPPDCGRLAVHFLESAPQGKSNKIYSLQMNQAGVSQLGGEHGHVKLDPQTGALYLKLPESMSYVWVATSRVLKGKKIHCMVLRSTYWDCSQRQIYERFPNQARQQGQGYLLMLQCSAKNHSKSRPVSNFIAWPGFWYTCDLELLPRQELQCRRQELRPGGVAVLNDGSVIFVSNPESLRKARLTIYRATSAHHLAMPGLVVNLTAPQAGQDDWGVMKRRMRGLLTLKPDSRAPASVWVVRRGTQMVLLIHARDRRVALSQLPGPEAQFLCHRHWDAWFRHDPRPVVPLHHRLHIRGKHDVPMCDRILAVVPCDAGILVFHQRNRRLPAAWSVRLEATSFDMVTIWRQWQHGRWSLLEDLPDSLPGDVYIEGQSLEFLRLELGEEPAGRGRNPWEAAPEPSLLHWKTQLEV